VSNTNAPHGLMPLGVSLSGGPQAIEVFSKPSTLNTAIFRYDPVARLADGSISSKQADITPGSTLYSGVALAYGAASTATDHHVLLSPDAIFEAQTDSTGLVATDMGCNANLEYGAGSAVTKLSGWIINHTPCDGTSTSDVHLLRKFDVPTNDYGAYARLEIVFNKHRMAPGVAGV